MWLLHTTDPTVIAKIGDLEIGPRPRQHPTPTKRQRIFERDAGVCQLCGEPVAAGKRRGPSLDHIVRWDEGGCNRDLNLRLAHIGCNLERERRERAAKNSLGVAQENML